VSDERQLRRGDIWLFEPDPVVGREQSGVRPGVVVSIDIINLGPREIVVLVPITGQQRPSDSFPFHVRIDSEMSGLTQVSFAMCEQVRVVSHDRVYGRHRRGTIEETAMLRIEDSLRIILGL
jgi:mRNA interferase MazF